MTDKALPIAPTERFISLDLLRGIAVLGILIMNIQSFSMIGAAYSNPVAYGDFTGLNWWAWALSHVFADQKFMTLFSILFGAGVVMMADRAERRGHKAVGVHYRRTGWLFVFGFLHAYLLWYGDILVIYALCSAVVFLFRKMAPTKLFIFGLLVFSVASLLSLFFGFSMSSWPPESVQNLGNSWLPPQAVIDAEVAAYRGGWIEQMAVRIPSAIALQTIVFLTLFLWRAGGLMLVGMALYKWNVLTAGKSSAFYKRLSWTGFLVGIPVVSFGVYRHMVAGFSVEYSMFLGGAFNYWGALFMAAGYLGLIMVLYQRFSASGWVARMAGVGRMALTNYLLMTILCTTLFYGHGLGWYGSVERSMQLVIVAVVWAVLIAATSWWLKRFQFGPFEWLWRSLTYWNKQPFRLKAAGV